MHPSPWIVVMKEYFFYHWFYVYNNFTIYTPPTYIWQHFFLILVCLDDRLPHMKNALYEVETIIGDVERTQCLVNKFDRTDENSNGCWDWICDTWYS